MREDPVKGKECITSEQGEAFKEKIGAVCYRESSAKQHKGIEEIFQLCAQIKLDPESVGIKPKNASSNNQKSNQKKDDDKKGGCLMM